MKISIEVTSIGPMPGWQLYDILQTLTPQDCDKIAALDVDGMVWFNEVLSAFRPE